MSEHDNEWNDLTEPRKAMCWMRLVDFYSHAVAERSSQHQYAPRRILVMHTPFTIIRGIYSRIIFLVFSLSVSPVCAQFVFIASIAAVVTLGTENRIWFCFFRSRIYTFLLFDRFRCFGVRGHGVAVMAAAATIPNTKCMRSHANKSFSCHNF